MKLPYNIEQKELMTFVDVFAKQYSGKEWSINNFKKGLVNWIKPKSSEPTTTNKTSKENLNIPDVRGCLLPSEKELNEMLIDKIKFMKGTWNLSDDYYEALQRGYKGCIEWLNNR